MSTFSLVATRKEQQLARLDKIATDEYERKKRWQQAQVGLSSDHSPSAAHTSLNNHTLPSLSALSRPSSSNSIPPGSEVAVGAASVFPAVPYQHKEDRVISFKEEPHRSVESAGIEHEHGPFDTGELDEDSSTRFV